MFCAIIKEGRSFFVFPAEVEEKTFILARLCLFLALEFLLICLLLISLLYNTIIRISNIVIILHIPIYFHLLFEEFMQLALDAVDEVRHFVEQTACVEAVAADEVRDVGVIVGQLKVHCFF